MEPEKVLAFSAASGRIAYVYFERSRLRDLSLSSTASASPKNAAKFARRHIIRLNPDVVITEKIAKRSRKGAHTRALVQAMAREAASHEVLDVSIARVQHHANKYAEAESLAKRFPELKSVLPKPRRIWEKEPPALTYFEAAALALEVFSNKSPRP